MSTNTKPYQTRASDLDPAWHVMDAEGETLGRLSSKIAILLMGKHKPTYVPYLNTGDYVIVLNADKFHVTGKKLEKKMYYRHSGYHGGLREQTLSDVLAKSPLRVIKQAVKGMLPKNTIGRRMLSRLKLYTGGEHPHEAQINAGRRAAKRAGAVEAAHSEQLPAEAEAAGSDPASPDGASSTEEA